MLQLTGILMLVLAGVFLLGLSILIIHEVFFARKGPDPLASRTEIDIESVCEEYAARTGIDMTDALNLWLEVATVLDVVEPRKMRLEDQLSLFVLPDTSWFLYCYDPVYDFELLFDERSRRIAADASRISELTLSGYIALFARSASADNRVAPHRRRRLAGLLRHLASGCIEPSAYAEAAPTILGWTDGQRPASDKALWQIDAAIQRSGLMKRRRRRRGRSRHRGDAQLRQDVARWILFLHSDLQFECTEEDAYFVVDGKRTYEGLRAREESRPISKRADLSAIWPFHRKEDLDRVRSAPILLAGWHGPPRVASS